MLLAKVSEMDRVRLARLPTPLEEMKNISNFLSGPRLLVKRDDETGLAFGGNKVRKLEFIIGDALKQEGKVLITSGGLQTNWGRLAVAAAVKFGLKPVLVLTEEEPETYSGNLCLDYLMGAELHFVSVESGLEGQARMRALREAGEVKVSEITEYYRSQGLKPYPIPRAGRTSQASAGYLLASLEIYQQLLEMGEKADYIVTAVGSTSTMSSLILGNKLLQTGIKIIGVSVSRPKDECESRIFEQLEKDIEFYGLPISIRPDDVRVFEDYIGPGYAIPTPDGVDAIKLLASQEAIMLDHVYTGKGMAGLLGLIRQGFFEKEDTVIFLHTGGGPGLFSLADQEFRPL